MDFFSETEDSGVVDLLWPPDDDDGLNELYSLKTSFLCSVAMLPHQKQA